MLIIKIPYSVNRHQCSEKEHLTRITRLSGKGAIYQIETKDPFASPSILTELGSESLDGSSRLVLSSITFCNDGNVLYLQYPGW